MLREIFQDVSLPVPVNDVMRKLTELGLDRLEGTVAARELLSLSSKPHPLYITG